MAKNLLSEDFRNVAVDEITPSDILDRVLSIP